MMAVSTVMMNWMMVFQVFKSLRSFIKSSLVFVLVLLDNTWSFVLKREERERGEQAASIAVYWMLLAAEFFHFSF
jgi:hypothetical protein